MQLEAELNSFDPQARQSALAALIDLAASGAVETAAAREVVNLHCHTFFSYNAYGYSPTALAWLARRQGFAAVGIVDFDVLDGVDEFLDACARVGVRGSAGLETRVHIPSFSTREINSPGEPGVCYHMGIGFTTSQVPEAVAPILASMRARAERRNREMLERINSYLAPVTLDYAQDVLPLTPAGNATERHMLSAYISAAAAHFPDHEQRCVFWAAKLSTPVEQIRAIIDDYARFSNVVRSKLMKKGGIGYVTPTPESFPTVDEVHQFILACDALPCAAWLDGTSAGEQAIDELLALLIDKGVVALNIVPDRNWNIADPETKRIKLANLYAIVRLANELDLPLNVGTEMNSPGNKLVDDFDAPELAPVRGAFLDGAYFVYGHTALQRAAGLGYQSAWAHSYLPTRRERNAFYTAVGRALPPGAPAWQRLPSLGPEWTPSAILAAIST